jgi:hypothetical protein
MIPAMLWPGWTMRLLPPSPDRSSAQQADPRINAFRRGCASFLLLPGGPPQLNFERVGPLLGNHQRDPDRDAVQQHLATPAATADTVHDTADALGLTWEHVRLYSEITDTGQPRVTASRAPITPTRAEILDPEHLRDLYEHQHLPLTDIARMAGCSAVTIRALLRLDGVPQRAHYRRPPPESGITRAWLQREYVDNLRSISALARDRGVTPYYLANLAKIWGLPIRPPSRFNGIGHLHLPTPPSPAIRAVTTGRGALGGLALITQIPGHTSITAAAHALYDGRVNALRQRIYGIEKAAGFTIIDQSTTPLAPTKPGRAFLDEALQILRAAQTQRGGTRERT